MKFVIEMVIVKRETGGRSRAMVAAMANSRAGPGGITSRMVENSDPNFDGLMAELADRHCIRFHLGSV